MIIYTFIKIIFYYNNNIILFFGKNLNYIKKKYFNIYK